MKIGISKGRVEEEFYKRLIDRKIIDNYDSNSRTYETDVDNDEIYLLKACDIIPFLNDRCIDIGILGSDIIEECNNGEIVELGDFDKGKCSFTLATFPNIGIENIKTVATKYPYIANELLKSMNLKCIIKKMNGSLEIAPKLNYADAIIDIVETGNTLKANGLVELLRFNMISTRIVSRKENQNETEIREFVRKIGG